MGRKKKAKKIIKEALKKDKKKTKSSPKKEEKIIKPKKKFPFKKFLAFLSFLFFSSVTAFLLIASFQANEISKYFSEKDTILTFEINSDLKNVQTSSSLSALANTDIKTTISNLFSTDFETKISPWLGRSAGIAFIRNEKLGLSPIYFMETASKKRAFEVLNISANGKQIITLPEYYFPKNDYFEKPLFLTVIDSYMFFSPHQEALTALLKMQNKSLEKLSKSQKYRNIKASLPSKRLAFLYINSENFVPGDLNDFDLPTGLLLALSDIFTSEGISISENKGDFYLSSFTNLSKPYTSAQNEKGVPASFPYNQNLQAIFAFKNPKNFLKNVLSVTSRLETLYPGISTLLENDFAFSLSKNGEIGIMINSLDEKETSVLSDMIFSLAQSFEGFDKDIREATLPDGTKYQEYVKIPKQILTTEKYHETEKYFDYSGKIFLHLKEDFAIISLSEDHLKMLLDADTKMKVASSTLKVNLNSDLFYEITMESEIKNGGIFSSSKLKIK